MFSSILSTCGGVRRRQAAADVLKRAVPLDELELHAGAVGEARLQYTRAVLLHRRHVAARHTLLHIYSASTGRVAYRVIFFWS